MNHNQGYLYVGNSADTPQFALDALASWWIGEGQGDFPEADKILLLADTGAVIDSARVAGSNSFKNSWPIGWGWQRW